MSGCVLPHDEHTEADNGLLCRRHRRELDDLTSEIGLLVIDTCRIIDGGAPTEATPKTRHLKQPEAPAPGNLVIMALYDARTLTTRLAEDQSEPMIPVLHMVASWLLLVAEERPLTATLPSSVLGQLDLLARHHDWLAAHDAVDDYWSEMREVRQHLRSAVNDRTHTRVGTCDLPIEGGTCGGALLVANGSSVIRCSRCRSEWVTAQEQARLAVRLG